MFTLFINSLGSLYTLTNADYNIINLIRNTEIHYFSLCCSMTSKGTYKLS